MHSCPFRCIVLGAILTFSHLLAGLEDLTVLVSPDGKQYAILAGDNHKRNPGTQTKRLAAAIAECQKNDPTPFQVSIEKPAELFRLFDYSPCITADLEPALQTLQASGISIEDCEVRNVSILAFWLFGKEYPSSSSCILKTGGKECKVKTATLHDLDQEFNDLYNSLTEFNQSLAGDLRTKFEKALITAFNHMKEFRKWVAPHIDESKTIIQTAIKLAAYDRENPWTYERERIRNLALDPFSQLFNLQMIRKILVSTTSKQLLLAGLLHTRPIKQFLLENCWKIHPNPNADQRATDPELISFAPILEKESALEV
jgi:hypothetical protein